METDFLSRASRLLGSLNKPRPDAMRSAMEALGATVQELGPFLQSPGVFPYGRKAILSTEWIELMVMNWSPQQLCSPHDHGGSFGWIQLVEGNADHVLYTLDQEGIPVQYLRRRETTGSMYFAARGMIHAMGNATRTPMVTLHAYSPPITGMKVYDPEKCLVCRVSDDCGAWWPAETRQQLEILKLREDVGSSRIHQV